MAQKKLFKIEERFKRPEAIGLFILFNILYLYKSIHVLIEPSTSGFGTQEVVIIGAIFAIVWYLIFSYRMKVRFSSKSLKIGYNTVIGVNRKITKPDVEHIEFVKIPEAALWNGWGVHFNATYNSYGFGDNAGLRIKLKDGNDVYVFCNRLYENRAQLTEKLTRNDWVVL